ncbi:hypothetical protein PRIPAC_90227 [Pristionchus pacificus]|uniref:ShK domain-containing protein n=1 Tax=Pristionchus pacificus TaxID=54126 RepID=A0A2A6CXG3_PRIPA|nr:hypothetical protein PRIPAC_90227 [Pristionchus pacificus]|eukprot:PDM82747.1 ShK domain-containing protein [Pristionchus pacificus]
MLRSLIFTSFIAISSAMILPHGFASVIVRSGAATCVDTQTPAICIPSTCKTMPNLAYDSCRKSCGWCDLTQAPCQNVADDKTCDAYKAANQCSMSSMQANCAKSCGVCTDLAPPVNPTCKNAAADATCDAYKAADMCAVASVIVNCKKSCSLC